MGFHDVEITYEAMRLAHNRKHLKPHEIASKIAANIMHDLPSGAYIDRTTQELQLFIHELNSIKKRLK